MLISFDDDNSRIRFNKYGSFNCIVMLNQRHQLQTDFHVKYLQDVALWEQTRDGQTFFLANYKYVSLSAIKGKHTERRGPVVNTPG
jgi:hypothetical protein